MKNVNPNQLKKCIFLYVQELEAILSAIYEEDVYIDVHHDGMEFILKSLKELHEHNVCQALSEYYDVNVTSIHIDDDTYIFCNSVSVGVWVVYKEELQ